MRKPDRTRCSRGMTSRRQGRRVFRLCSWAQPGFSDKQRVTKRVNFAIDPGGIWYSLSDCLSDYFTIKFPESVNQRLKPAPAEMKQRASRLKKRRVFLSVISFLQPFDRLVHERHCPRCIKNLGSGRINWLCEESSTLLDRVMSTPPALVAGELWCTFTCDLRTKEEYRIGLVLKEKPAARMFPSDTRSSTLQDGESGPSARIAWTGTRGCGNYSPKPVAKRGRLATDPDPARERIYVIVRIVAGAQRVTCCRLLWQP
jgi:hypothetical protein